MGPHSRPIPLPWLLAGAAAFAAAEFAAGLLVGRFFAWGRAEALLFLAFRPALLVVTVLLAARYGWRWRAALYGLALLTAGLSESLLLTAVGGAPWLEMLRGWAAGAPLALLLDLAIQLGRRIRGRVGQAVAAALAALLLFVPGALAPYEALVLGPTGARPVAARPELLLMTGLPIVWGETGPFDPAGRPAAAYRLLQQEYAVRPLDHLDARTLSGGRLMLLAQPRMLEPTELVALDDWVRRGGRLLLLADPALRWPSRLPLGDLRRPPPASLLSPLLGHWGLRLETAPDRPLVVDHLRARAATRRLALAAPGRFAALGDRCRVGPRDFLAFCRIGAGRVLLVADADLLHDHLWAGPGGRGAERHARQADNGLLIADWLDRLAGLDRRRAARPVRWLLPPVDRGRAVALGALPILLLLAAAGIHRFIHRPEKGNIGGTESPKRP